MTIEVVFETHSTTVDNEEARATGWWPGQLSERGRAQARELGRRHIATKWGLEHHLRGASLEDLADGGFAWQTGWEYVLR